MRTPPNYWNRYQATEGVPGDIAAGPNPVEASLEELALTNPDADVDTGPKYQISPQDYIRQIFEQMQRRR